MATPNCNCNQPAADGVKKDGGTSDKNSGRKYYTCGIRKQHYNSDLTKEEIKELPGCEYFEWADEVGKRKRKRSFSNSTPKTSEQPPEKKQRETYTLMAARKEISELTARVSELAEQNLQLTKHVHELANLISEGGADD